jgi:nitric oxide reductase NorQ protein
MAKSVRTPMPAQFRLAFTEVIPMTTPAAPAAAPKGRLGNGQLRRQVAEYLTDHPGPCKTGEIAKALDRSAGAVGNALTTLAGRGEADLVPGKPIRYQANSATAAAAAAIAPKAPLPPKPAPAPTPAAPAAPAAPAPAPTPAFTPKPAAAGPVTRPNGQVYQPRSLADMPDVEALRRLREAGVPALLYGPPGTGKTSLVEAAATPSRPPARSSAARPGPARSPAPATPARRRPPPPAA